MLLSNLEGFFLLFIRDDQEKSKAKDLPKSKEIVWIVGDF